MKLSHLRRRGVIALPLLVAALFAASSALSQPAPKGKIADLLKPQPRPKKADVAPSVLPLEFATHERIAFVGNSTAERMNLFGHFETILHTEFPDKQLVVRNFGFPADEVSKRQRSNDYTSIDDPLYAFNPDTFFCFFGFNESFAGKDGVEKFRADYERFIDEFTNKYPRDDAKSPPRFVLVSPIAFEPTGDKFLPDGVKENENLKLYVEAVKAVAAKRKLAFIDVFTPTVGAFAAEPGLQYTVNGAHADDAGDKLVAKLLATAVAGREPGKTPTERYERVRAAVNDKSWVHMQDYRMLNGWYVYGGRRTYDTETFPREYAKLRAMAAVRDQFIWDIAGGKQVAAKPDDSNTGELYEPPTRFGQQKYSENPELGYSTPEEFIKGAKVAPGTELKLFADEKRFPEIAKPVQMNFDSRGRLWLSCMPSYPLWKPGDPRASDKLVILEDTDNDGSADKSTVFYDKLHCPTGFEFYNGGVLVMDQPRMLWLKDTDGDDKADEVVHLFDGWASDDTHHRGGWEWSPGGNLHMLEGIATSTTLETPWGPHRSSGAGGCYVIDPRSLKIRQFALPGMYNMWCYVFDEWGQGIVGDGTTQNQAWDTPLSGAQYGGRKGLNFLLPNGVRPNLGNEWIVSRNLPDDLQHQFTYACVIQMNGLTRYEMVPDGAYLKGNRKPDLVSSPDKHFRPCDPQIGPDGALWFGDWANALIGHMQYSQRDPNRDHVRGRVYRLVGKDRPLVKPVLQKGKSVAELLEQTREYELRTRYRARRALRDLPAADVLAGISTWVAKLDPKDREVERLRCEALWAQQGHHGVDPALLAVVLKSKAEQARAAAVRVAADERAYLPSAFAILMNAALDDSQRVRAEAIRGLSFFPTPEAAAAVLEAMKKPSDYYVKYTGEAALGANEAAWRQAYIKGELAKGDAEAKKLLDGIMASAKTGGEALPFLQLLLGKEPAPAETRNKAMQALADLKGNPSNGRAIFQRNCTACHKVGNGEGQEYGPNLDKVATRLKTKIKLVESIIDPNAEVDKKYLSTRLDLTDGKSLTGLLVSENKDEVVLFDGKDRRTIPVSRIDERQTLKQSSMPEGMAAAMAPVEFLDLMAYLDSLK